MNGPALYCDRANTSYYLYTVCADLAFLICRFVFGALLFLLKAIKDAFLKIDREFQWYTYLAYTGI